MRFVPNGKIYGKGDFVIFGGVRCEIKDVSFRDNIEYWQLTNAADGDYYGWQKATLCELPANLGDRELESRTSCL